MAKKRGGQGFAPREVVMDKVEQASSPPPVPDVDNADLTGRTLLIGLLSTAGGWFFFGASLEAVLTALDPTRPAWSVESWLRSTAFVAASYVAAKRVARSARRAI